MTEDRDQTKRWIDEAEEALNRTAEALRAAWEETKEARTSTLEAAREAVNRLAAAIDQGIEAAKQSWDPTRGTDDVTDTQETTQEEE